jgi:DNA-binding CsgD family transcriptional regulator
VARKFTRSYIQMMQDGYQALTEREKQTLRLLVNGYDAKSMARHLGLSVHTVNERLRDARRKMATSSSREAARLLREVEAQDPEIIGDKTLGDATFLSKAQVTWLPAQGDGKLRRTGWIVGGLAMTISLALLALSALSGSSQAPAVAGEATTTAEPAQQQAEQAARQFLALVDARDWRASYAATGSVFKKANTLERWSSAAEGAHGALGPAQSRDLLTADYSPAPPNGVWNIRFRSHFADGREVIETVAVAQADGGWRVVGLVLD